MRESLASMRDAMRSGEPAATANDPDLHAGEGRRELAEIAQAFNRWLLPALPAADVRRCANTPDRVTPPNQLDRAGRLPRFLPSQASRLANTATTIEQGGGQHHIAERGARPKRQVTRFRMNSISFPPDGMDSHP